MVQGAAIVSDSLLKVIASSSDRAWLKQCRAYNLERGRKDVVRAVDQRLREIDFQDALKIRPEAHTVEQRVFESVRVYRALLKHEHGKNQAAGYTEREIKQHGAREALIRTIRRGKQT